MNLFNTYEEQYEAAKKIAKTTKGVRCAVKECTEPTKKWAGEILMVGTKEKPYKTGFPYFVCECENCPYGYKLEGGNQHGYQESCKDQPV